MEGAAGLEITRYRGRGDLARFLAFASSSTAARAPLRSQWSPGDLAWQLRGHYDEAHALYGFGPPEAFVAVAWFQWPGELIFEMMPGHEALAAQLLAWTVDKARAAPAAVQSSELRLTAYDSDHVRLGELARAGFRRTGAAGVHFIRSLADALPAPEPPPFVRLADSVGIDPERRARAHRAPWSALAHLGIEGESRFSAAEYLSLLTTPAYDPAFDIVAERDDGLLVANALAWCDLASGVGTFEPVGVHPDHRGRRLAGAAMLEAMHRLQAAGARLACVGTAHFNAPAIAAYRRNFVLVDRSSTWSHSLA